MTTNWTKKVFDGVWPFQFELQSKSSTLGIVNFISFSELEKGKQDRANLALVLGVTKGRTSILKGIEGYCCNYGSAHITPEKFWF